MHRLSQGGADRVGILLANAFVRAGIPTRLALLRDGGEAEQSLLALVDPQVTVVHAGRAMASRHLELARGLRFIRRQITERRPSVVLASSSNMGLVTGIAARIPSGAAPGGLPDSFGVATAPLMPCLQPWAIAWMRTPQIFPQEACFA
jgi:hypothetical protein